MGAELYLRLIETIAGAPTLGGSALKCGASCRHMLQRNAVWKAAGQQGAAHSPHALPV